MRLGQPQSPVEMSQYVKRLGELGFGSNEYPSGVSGVKVRRRSQETDEVQSPNSSIVATSGNPPLPATHTMGNSH